MKRVSYLLLPLCIASIAQGVALIPYDPFYKAEKILKKSPKQRVHKQSQAHIRLLAIYNDTAFINGKFYKKNDKIGTYTIVKIFKKGVVLKNSNRIKVLRLIQSTDYVKTKEVENVQ